MEGELKFGLSLSTIWETFSDIFWMVLISVAMVRAERSEKVAERRDMVLVLVPVLAGEQNSLLINNLSILVTIL